MMIMNLVREDLRDFIPYQTAKMRGDREYIRLHANESPWGADDLQLNRYPKMLAIESLCNFYQVNTDQLLVTRGSNDGIDLLLRLFCRAQYDEILSLSPTYGMYQIAAQLQGVKTNQVALNAQDNFEFNLEAILTAITVRTKLLFICSPNNPTGTCIDLTSIRRLCEENLLVVIDEAYIEFSDRLSAVSLLNKCPNLVILRTLSKAFGLAGLRAAVVLADQEVIRYLQAIMPPYAIPTPCQTLLLEAFRPERIMQMWINVALIKRSRRNLQKALKKLPFVEAIYPSEANFILLKVTDVDALVEFAADQGILLRKLSGKDNLLRMSVGSDLDNSLLLEVLSQWGCCNEN